MPAVPVGACNSVEGADKAQRAGSDKEQRRGVVVFAEEPVEVGLAVGERSWWPRF